MNIQFTKAQINRLAYDILDEGPESEAFAKKCARRCGEKQTAVKLETLKKSISKLPKSRQNEIRAELASGK